MKEGDIIISTSEKLEIVLKRLDVNKKELAEKLGTPQSNLSKKMKYDNWRESDIKDICSALGIECEIVFKLKNGETI